MMNKLLLKVFPILLFIILFSDTYYARGLVHLNGEPAIIEIIFTNNVKNNKLVLNDSTYINPFGESYVVTKLRYYITNIFVVGIEETYHIRNSYYLVDESKPESMAINLTVPSGKYKALGFLLGVDSLHNVSGAQSGVLDPINDMFWTWNSGYVMEKMEGNSPSSREVNQKFEYHIGGYTGPDKVLQTVQLAFPDAPLDFKAGKKYTVYIDSNINSVWESPNPVKISENPVITTPGKMAKEMSENFAGMFHVKEIDRD
jgi:MbnP